MNTLTMPDKQELERQYDRRKDLLHDVVRLDLDNSPDAPGLDNDISDMWWKIIEINRTIDDMVGGVL